MVSSGFAQVRLAVATAGYADGDRVRGVCRCDVVRRVAEDEDALRVEGGAEDDAGAIDCLSRQLTAIGRVGAVAAEGEEAIQTCPASLM